MSANSNSFEHTTPFTEICQDKAIEMGPPLVIPKDLRPLGAKRRYLRTVQLIADPLLVAAASARNPLLDDRADVPFEESLRKKDPARMKLQKANSYTMLSIAKDKKSRPANGNHKNKPQHGRSTSELPEYVSEGRDEDGGGCFEEENENEEEEEEEGKALPRQRAKSGKLQTRPPPLLVRKVHSLSPWLCLCVTLMEISCCCWVSLEPAAEQQDSHAHGSL